MPLPLIALFLAAFGIGTAEFVIAGLLPEVSVDLGVSIPTAGFLITAYAIGVAVGGPIVTLLTSRYSRRNTILALIAVFTIGQALCAIAPNYPMLMAARLLVSIGHGAFFGVAAIVATRLVAPEKAGSAVSMLLAGITVANILGVPGGTAIGNALGWRATFWAVGLLGLLSLLAIMLLLPADKPEATHERTSLSAQFKVLGRPVILLSFAIIIVAMIGQFAVFTYIAPYLITVTNVPQNLVPWLLLLFGVGSTIGVLVGGRLADWKLMPSLIGMLLALTVVYAAMALSSYHAIAMGICILLWSGLSFGFGAPVQTRILRASADAPNLASPLIPTAFNLGIALGASIGAAALDHGWGYVSLAWIGSAVSLAAAVIAVVSWNFETPAKPQTECEAV
ncbi:MFS transporter [Paradevosia shaoguanensis]|uniref:MFS transporter n=1 Tax=Paradevosia shaoguanensis TaxID=1335043 RepID=A0AA41QN84_9HYPH|nr:MFS transporter [Paradevosia shaoguanensis]MCF1743483.1 MFS transporter [Paradevosia shaoguanensis]MCI0127966.1 MFS transporter [Paradevosia shaoguanensis]